jgi:hypothetical protein
MSRYFHHIAIAGLVVVALVLAGCAGVQDASRSRSEYVAEYGATVAANGHASEAELLRGIMPADQIRVEEYLNYYEQNFAAPSESVLRLDPILGNTHVPESGGEAWLQIGLQAAETTEQDARPTNVALVLDKSGSMAEANKMSYLKQSLRVFLEALHPEDVITIVVYDDGARVLLPAQAVGDGEQVRAVIDQLQPGGSTNLHGGLMLGYAEVQKYFDVRFNNRVILLTDGIANQGVINAEQIAADSLAYNQQGIFLSTIGLGLDLNDQLLSTLAEQGKGHYHFISDADEMERVFRQEALGLVQTVATDVWLTLDLVNGAQVERVYGYDYDLKGRNMRVQFDDAGAETNQILMVKLAVPAPQGRGTEQPLARATLEYNDSFADTHVVQQTELGISYGAPAPYDPALSPPVRRNVTILQMAEALQQVSFLVNQRDYEQALALVQEIKPRVWRIATEEGDEEMQEDVTLLDNYETILQKLVELKTSSPMPASRREQSGGICFAPLVAVGMVTLGLAMVGTVRHS